MRCSTLLHWNSYMLKRAWSLEVWSFRKLCLIEYPLFFTFTLGLRIEESDCYVNCLLYHVIICFLSILYTCTGTTLLNCEVTPPSCECCAATNPAVSLSSFCSSWTVPRHSSRQLKTWWMLLSSRWKHPMWPQPNTRRSMGRRLSTRRLCLGRWRLQRRSPLWREKSLKNSRHELDEVPRRNTFRLYRL